MSKISLKRQKNKDKIFINILKEIGIIINNMNLLGSQSHIIITIQHSKCLQTHSKVRTFYRKSKKNMLKQTLENKDTIRTWMYGTVVN